MNKKIALILVLSLGINYFANANIASINTKITNQTLENIALQANKINAKYWKISTNDYTKYKELKERYKGLVSTNITPLEYLGIFAENEQQRYKYAKLFAKVNRETTQKVLAFEKTFQRAYKDMYGLDDIIKYNSTQVKARLQKRIKHNIDFNSCDKQCIDYVKQLTNKSILTPVDLYFADATDSDINKFAFKLKLLVSDVNSGRVTLNHSN